jgi:hypothetical protein
MSLLKVTFELLWSVGCVLSLTSLLPKIDAEQFVEMQPANPF